MIKAKLPADCQIYLTSDYHFGSLNHSRSSLQGLIDTVASEDNSYLCNLGDSIECILPNDKRFSTAAVDWQSRLVTPEAQAKAVVEAFKPIADRVLVWMMGNHEHKVVNTCNLARYMADGLGVPYGSAACKLTMDFGNKKPIKFFLAHGSSTLRSNAKDNIQRLANMQAALKQKLERLAGDVIGMFVGHGHQLVAVDPTVEHQLYLTDNGKELKQHYRAGQDQSAQYIPPESRWYGMTGSFLRLFSPPGSESVGYGELALYAPSEIGCLVAIIRGGKMVGLEKVVY